MEPKRQFQDIVRQDNRNSDVLSSPPVTPSPAPAIVETPLETQLPEKPPKKSLWKWILGILVSLAIVVGATMGGGYMWYQAQLEPVDPQAQGHTLVKVEQGSTVAQIADVLKSKNLIKNAHVFKKYVKDRGAILHPGPYRLNNNSSVDQIVSKLQNAEVDEFNITFLPGATLKDAKKVLIDSGYSEKQVNDALSRTYDAPLLKVKPAGADLEGFVYGETYRFNSDATPEDILKRTFDEMYTYIQSEDLEAAFKKQGMTLYEGIIFASIIQKEVSEKKDMAHVSQVFHKRLKIGMELGSDVTFMYGAEKMGVPATVDLDSPYNTRVRKGLPPTPVANPGASALYAAAHPSSDDDLFFVAGDDGITYFSKTNEEHERLTREHCNKNCEIPDNGY